MTNYDAWQLTFAIFMTICVCICTSSNIWEELLGTSLYRWDSSGTSVEELKTKELIGGKKVVGLYFSASWCGPCRQFTPALTEFYKKMKKKTKGNFEIVWISGDRSEQEFAGYYQKMPWLAVPIGAAPQIYQQLSPLYKVRGIPHMVFLDGEDATVYTLDGRNMVMKDPYGLEYPYRPRSLAMFLPKPIKKILAAHVQSFKLILSGILDSFSLPKIIGFVRRQLSNRQQPAFT